MLNMAPAVRVSFAFLRSSSSMGVEFPGMVFVLLSVCEPLNASVVLKEVILPLWVAVLMFS